MVKINLKSVSGNDKYELNIDLAEKINIHVPKICEIFNALSVKLVYRGKVLLHDDTFESYNLKDDDTVVIVATKKPPTTTNTSANTTINTTASTATTTNTSTNATMSAAQPDIVYHPIPENSIPPLSNILYIPVQHDTTHGENIWTTNTVQTDSVSGQHLFNVEEVHAAFMLLIPTIAANETLVNNIRQNPNAVFTSLNNESMRASIRQSLKSSPQIVSSLKNGDEVRISLQTVQVPATPPLTATPPPALQQNTYNNALLQMFNSLLSGNPPGGFNFGNEDEDVGESDDDDGGDDETNNESTDVTNTQTQTQQLMTQDDLNNIQQIKEFTGASDEEAKQAYISCKKNVNLAAEKILRNY
jgi:hypothetical protein